MNWMKRKTLIYHTPVTLRMPSSSEVSNRSACIWFQNTNRRSLLLPIMIGILLLSLTQSTFACVQENIPSWLTDGPILEDTEASLQIPLKTFATKLFIEIELGGKPRRFVLDTGSPSMIDARLADELGLVKVGSSRGRDAHGHIIQSEVVQANLKIGGVWIKKVPMYKARFSDSVATQTFIGDGVLGSEVLKLGAWQIDLKNSLLRFNVQASALPFVADVDRQTLYDFGYPHSPIFDVHLSKSARSKAMLDTGSPNYFAISPDDFRGAKNENGIGHMISGFGSPGSSLGGQAAECDQRLAEMNNLSIDGLDLGQVPAICRDATPSLIGARLLEHFIVTLDMPKQSAYFYEFTRPACSQPSFGLTFAFNDEITVAMVWDDSAAAKAGIRPGLKLMSINGNKTQMTSQGIQAALEALKNEKIHLEWEGGSATLIEKICVTDDKSTPTHDLFPKRLF